MKNKIIQQYILGITAGVLLCSSAVFAATSNGSIGDLFESILDDINGHNNVQFRLNGENIQDKTVTNYELADSSVTTEKIKNLSVDSRVIRDENITTAKLAKDSVATKKIKDEAVTNEKIVDEAINSTIVENETIIKEDLNDSETFHNSERSDTADSCIVAKKIENHDVIKYISLLPPLKGSDLLTEELLVNKVRSILPAGDCNGEDKGLQYDKVAKKFECHTFTGPEGETSGDPGTPAKVNGVCGSSNGLTLTSKPTALLCSKGTPSLVSGNGPWNWTCNGINGGNSSDCSASTSSGTPTKVNGVCGYSNGATLSYKPSSGLCSKGVASSVSGSGPWTWSCSGKNGGVTANCLAMLSVTPGSGGGVSSGGGSSYGWLNTGGVTGCVPPLYKAEPSEKCTKENLGATFTTECAERGSVTRTCTEF